MAKAPPKRAMWFRATDSASVGIEIVVAIALGTFAGIWLERSVTHWTPWTTLIGMAIGLAAATKAVTRAARSYKRSLAESPSDTSSTPAPTRDDD